MKLLISIITLSLSLPMFALTVDTKASTFSWQASKKVGSKHYGKIPLKTSSLKTQKGNITGGEFTMDLQNFTVEDLKGDWQKKFLKHVKSDDFFNVTKYPTAKLVVQKVEKSVAHGELTIKGKTVTVKFPFKKTKNIYSGTLKFDRTKFGIIYGSGNFVKKLTVDKIINDEVTLNFNVAIK